MPADPSVPVSPTRTWPAPPRIGWHLIQLSKSPMPPAKSHSLTFHALFAETKPIPRRQKPFPDDEMSIYIQNSLYILIKRPFASGKALWVKAKGFPHVSTPFSSQRKPLFPRE